jgi:hypothetical protein
MSTLPIEEQYNLRTDADEDTFHALLTALDVGWWIELPVYMRPRWGREHSGQQRYHFILRRDTSMTMVNVADSSQVRAFVQDRGLQVNASTNQK